MDPTFIVMISFVVFMGIAYRLGYHKSMATLDHKIASIRQALDEASQAKEAAIQALNEERRQHGEITQEIELIAKRAEEQALNLRQQAMHDINKIIVARQKAAENMIKRMHNAAVQTIQEEATAQTLATFEALVTTKFSQTQHEALNDEAITQISTQLTKLRTPIAQRAKRPRAKRRARV